MPKFPHILGVIIASGLAMATANAAMLGPSVETCLKDESAVLVSVTGFKKRAGRLRVQLYANGPRYFEKDAFVERIDVAVPALGTVDICVPVAKPGRYVVSVRHDVNANGRSDLRDGGGFSGNPDVSIADVVGKRKPSLAAISFQVGDTTKRVDVVLNYVRGLSFGPLR